MNNIANNSIKKLTKVFFEGYLEITLEPEEIEHFTWDKQKEFLNLTVYSNLLQKYPINYIFGKMFFKKLICILEPLQEVHDDMYKFLCFVMQKSAENEFYYRHYMLNENLENNIIIRETKNMVVNGTTGLKTWEAAFILADWALCNPKIFASKNILELGSGVGFTGIAIAKHCAVKCMTMSDCHQDVLKTLRYNININFSDQCRDPMIESDLSCNNNDVIGATKLDWNDIDFKTQSNIIPDVIIGADIVYDPSILEPLCNVLNFFSQRNPNLEIYICSIIRNEDTFNAFLKTLESNDYLFKTIDHAENVHLNWDKSSKRRLIAIKKKTINN